MDEEVYRLKLNLYSNYHLSSFWSNVVIMEKIENEFLTIKEFAWKLGVHPNTIRRGIKSGRIGGFKVGGGKRSTYRIPRCEINRIALFDMEEMIERIIEKRKNLAN